MALSDILLANGVADWHESIAVVRDVAASLIESGRTAAVPDLQQVFLSAAGEISISGGATSNEPVRRLGQLLQAALGQSEPPVQLRLIIAQATSPTPAFTSIQELDASLAYFERPDRRGVLRTLHSRVASAPARAEGVPVPTLDSVAPLVEKREQPKKSPRRPANRARERLVAVSMAAVLLGVAGVQYSRTHGTSPRAIQVSAVANRVSQAAAKFFKQTLSTISERVGFGRLIWPDGTAATPAPAPAPAVEAPVPSTVKRTQAAIPADIKLSTVRRAAVIPPAAPEPPPLLAFDLDPAVASKSAALDEGESTITSVSVRDAVIEKEEEPPPGASIIYSPEAVDVLPPVAVRPQLPTDLPPDVRREDLISIELIVASNGTVDSVKLVGPLQGLGDWLWLSTVKAWQFRPALKDGRAVPYRKTVWIAYPDR
jgi:hypothetical protein